MQTISDATDGPSRRRRVPAMAPEERRAALIEATIPLLREHGLLVTTRQIADTAGVAEGTIFGVFPDKPTLIREAVLAALNPETAIRGIQAVDPQGGLRERLIDVARILQRRYEENGQLLHLVRGVARPQDDDPTEMQRWIADAQRRTVEAVAAAIEPDRDQLRLSPQRAAHFFVSLVFAVTRHALVACAEDERPMSPEIIVSLLLDGLVLPESAFDTIMNFALDEHVQDRSRQAFGIAFHPNTGEPA